MHPAPSVILFTVLSGLGFGFLAFLGLGFPSPQGWLAFWLWGLGYALAVAGLLASTFHLGNPQRALMAFTQWRTSWLSREAWASVITLLVLAPKALSDWLGLDWPPEIGIVGGLMALATVTTTSMIYAQLKTVPRWNHWSTPALFLGFALTGGALLAGQGMLAALLSLALTALLFMAFRLGDTRFAERGQTIGAATGLGGIGGVRVFEQGHTADNYLLREMMFRVGRKHALTLRRIALTGVALPVLLMLAPNSLPLTLLALAAHVTGALAARWLFFAEAEHVVGLYYGRH
jgi:DMSO reductase anchor subunit